MVGLFMPGGGDSVGFGIMSFDAGLLSDWYAVRSGATAMNPALIEANAARKHGPAVIPPWDTKFTQPDEDERLRKALATSSFIDFRGDAFNQPGLRKDFKDLFAAYKALGMLSAIANHAADKKTSPLMLNSFDRKFQQGLAQLYDFIGNFSSDEFILAAGAKSNRAESSVSIPRVLSEYTTRVIHRDAFDAPLSGLQGDEVFTISVSKMGAATDIVIDLSQMGAEPRNLDNIVAFINGKLEEAEMVTRFERVRIEPPKREGDKDSGPYLGDTWGMRIKGVSTEVLRFSAADTAPRLYLAGVSGQGDHIAGQFLSFSDFESGEPVMTMGARIEVPEAGSTAKKTVVDSQGNVYVAGTTTGDMGNNKLQGEQDIFLRKYDSTGQLVWTRMLGASESAEVFDMTVDADDNLIIVGEVHGQAVTGANGGGADTFVVKYDDRGNHIFTRQIAPRADDRALAVTTGPDGAIYVGGVTEGALAGQAHGGGRDGYITRLDASGALQWNHQFGGAGDERVTAMAVNDDGHLLVASIEEGVGVLRRYDPADPTAPIWEKVLGEMQGGTISAIAVDGNRIWLGGSTANGALDVNGEAAIIGSHGGAQDGFVMALDDDGSTAAAASITYVGTGATDRIHGLTVHNGAVYVAGETQGALDGATQVGTIDGFISRIDGDGSIAYSHQYSGRGGYAKAHGIAIDENASSVLSVLGLPGGRLDYGEPRAITAQTSVRAGQYFEIAINDGRPIRYTIHEGETLAALSRRIQRDLTFDGVARSRRTPDGDSLRIEARKGVRIELIAGAGGQDALRGLGMKPGLIVQNARINDDDELTASMTPVYGLGLSRDFNLRSHTDAAHVAKMLQEAMSQLRKAFREHNVDPVRAALMKGQGNQAKGPVPAYLQNQLANYNAGLARLNGGGGFSGLF